MKASGQQVWTQALNTSSHRESSEGLGVQENQIGKKMHTLQNESKTKQSLGEGREYEELWQRR